MDNDIKGTFADVLKETPAFVSPGGLVNVDRVDMSAVLRNFNERRDAEGQFLRGLVCGLDSDDVRKQNIQEALERFRKLAEQGDTAAQEFLARCFEQGIGVKRDKKKAAEWRKKAAEPKGRDNSEWKRKGQG